MARIRSVKPEFWADEDFARDVPNRDARLLYIGLWNLADEHSRLRGDPRYVKGQVFAYDDDLTPAVIDSLLDQLARAGKVQRYRSGSSAYLFLPNLAKHQRLETSKVESRLPAPPDPSEPAPMAAVGADKSARDPDEPAPRADVSPPSANDSALLYGSGSMEPGAGGMEPGSGDAALNSPRTKRGTRIPADFAVTPEMVAWATERCPQVDGRLETEKFVNHWRGKSGKDATKVDWPATWRNWMLNARDRYGARASPNGGYVGTSDRKVGQVDVALANVKAKMQQQNGAST